MLDRIATKISNIDSERISRYLVVLISLCLVLVFSKQFWSIYQTASFTPKIDLSAAQTKNINSGDYNAGIIGRNNIFGTTNTANVAIAKLPTTNLQLTLRGAFTSSNPELASAMIEGPDKKTRSYKVKAPVYGNAILHSVYGNRVILSRNGILETLYFPVSKNDAPTGSAAYSAANIPNDVRDLILNNATVDDIRDAAAALKPSSMTAKQRQQLIRSRLQELRNRSKNKG